jgi:hypothetical protein
MRVRVGDPRARSLTLERKLEMAKATTPANWVALCVTPMGGGSWIRETTKEQAVQRCARLFKSDWSHLFKIKKGDALKINVFDVTGMDEIFIGDNGVEFEGKPVPRHSVEAVTL